MLGLATLIEVLIDLETLKLILGLAADGLKLIEVDRLTD
jgi:hypothetical protein